MILPVDYENTAAEQILYQIWEITKIPSPSNDLYILESSILFLEVRFYCETSFFLGGGSYSSGSVTLKKVIA